MNSFQNIIDESINIDIDNPIRTLRIIDNNFIDNRQNDQSGALQYRPGLRIGAIMPAKQFSLIINNNFDNATKPLPHFSVNRGIWIQNVEGSRIERNDFIDNFSTSSTQYEGIFLWHAPAQVWSNDFIGSGNLTDYPSTGIQVRESTSCWLNCNTLDQTQVGIRFWDFCSSAILERNEFNTHQSGLLLTTSAVTGVQANRHNKWFGNSVNTEALFEGRDPNDINDVAFVQQSIFKVRHSNPSEYWPLPRMIGVASDPGIWFEPEPGSTGLIYCVLTPEEDPGPGGGSSTSLTLNDSRIIAGNFHTAKGYPAEDWEVAVRLYKKLTENPALMPILSTAESWFSSKQNTTVGSLGSIYSGIYQLSEYSQQDMDDLDSLETGYKSAVAVIKAIDESISNAIGNPSAVAQLLADRAANEPALTAAGAAYLNLLTTIKNERIADAQSLLGQLNTISTFEEYETDFKTVCRILLETYVATELEENNRQTLKSIANKCRYEIGIATVQARASLEADASTYDVYDDCADYVEERNDTVEGVNKMTALFPNPTDREAILFFKGEGSTGSAVLRNLNGQKIAVWKFEQSKQVKLSWNEQLPPGMYILEVLTDNNPPETIKLVIQQE